MTGLVLRLAGPLSSFGHRGTFHHRDTAPFPTRSALIGLFAAAQGLPRHQALDPHTDLPGTPSYHDLTFTVRIDRPGTPLTDFHTVGGGHPPHRRLHTSAGGHRPRHTATLISHRDYLADAAFTVAVHGPTPLTTRIADTLEHPRYAPYLGRRCCIPDEPLLLHATAPDPAAELLHHTPLTLATPPPPGRDTVPVPFIWEQPPSTSSTATTEELADDPADFTPARRHHRQRTVWHTTEHLPARLYAGPRPLDALTTYLLQETPCPPN